jgi:hypothetical protein
MIATPSQAKLLYYLSALGLLTGTAGIVNGKFGLGAGVCVGSYFAQNYWRDPQYGWRRNVDMAWLQVLIWSHLWYVSQSQVLVPYLEIQSLGVLFYALSWYHLKKGELWHATVYHGAVHLCANGSLLLYYSASS